jgi:hypothetical protein
MVTPFLLENSVTFAVLTTALWWVSWLAFLGLAIAMWLRSTRLWPSVLTQRLSLGPWWLLLLAICPIVMLFFGSLFWEKALPGSASYFVVYVIHGLLVLQVLIAYGLAIFVSNRRAATVVANAVGLAWGFGTFTVAGFSVTGSWP